MAGGGVPAHGQSEKFLQLLIMTSRSKSPLAVTTKLRVLLKREQIFGDGFEGSGGLMAVVPELFAVSEIAAFKAFDGGRIIVALLPCNVCCLRKSMRFC